MKICFFLLLLYLPVLSFSQKLEDVVYLKNGSIIRGRLISDNTGNHVRILNHSGDVWSFALAEVDSLKSEKVYHYEAAIYNEDGMEISIGGGLLVRSESHAISKSLIPCITLGYSYRLLSIFSGGIETGIDFYDWMILPASASMRIRNSLSPVSSFIQFKGGYSFPLESRPDDYQYSYDGKGGINASVGLGMERIISNNMALTISFAYQYQEMNFHLSPLTPWSVERDRKESYNRLRINLIYIFK